MAGDSYYLNLLTKKETLSKNKKKMYNLLDRNDGKHKNNTILSEKIMRIVSLY